MRNDLVQGSFDSLDLRFYFWVHLVPVRVGRRGRDDAVSQLRRKNRPKDKRKVQAFFGSLSLCGRFGN